MQKLNLAPGKRYYLAAHDCFAVYAGPVVAPTRVTFRFRADSGAVLELTPGALWAGVTEI